MMGTTMTITNNSRIAYTYRAELIGADGKAGAGQILRPARQRPLGDRKLAASRRRGRGSAISSRRPPDGNCP